MPYVVTQSCCSDASCVYACPVNCIHPTPDEPDFGTAEMLHIDPAACIECGACVSACPVDAIAPHSRVSATQQRFVQINADFYRSPRDRPVLAPVIPAPVVRTDRSPLRVAIVGTGPAAMYAADELATQPDVQITMLDRLTTPYGLARFGVAPDHVRTRQVARLFDTIAAQRNVTQLLGVEVGTDVSHEQLLDHHHAVVYASGAASDRRLDVDGEELPGCASATDFVAWYNGHPDHAEHDFDLSHPRVVIVGNGNVALDAARVLLTDPRRLGDTDIAPHALAALRASRVEDVLIIARRGAAQSAFTVPEFAGLVDSPDFEVTLDGQRVDDLLDDASAKLDADDALPHATTHKLRLLRELSTQPSVRRRVTLRYLATATRILGTDRVTGVELGRTELTATEGRVRARLTTERDVLEAGLVLTSIGYRGRPIPGLPFDEDAGTVPNAGGRVHPGTYVAGWIKRGPTGFIGTNKSCAQETVQALVADFNAGLLTEPARDPRAFRRLVSR